MWTKLDTELPIWEFMRYPDQLLLQQGALWPGDWSAWFSGWAVNLGPIESMTLEQAQQAALAKVLERLEDVVGRVRKGLEASP